MSKKTGPGEGNSLTDVAGVLVGHKTSKEYVSGVTVALCPESATCGVDVRGSAPGTRETDLLSPENLVEKVQAIVLTGGSVYGLSCADGVVKELAARGWGFPLAPGYVAPIVPAAALFDLGRGPDYTPPVGPEWGQEALENASERQVRMGTVGAGTGAVAGGLKGGIGSASFVLESGITVAALVAVNSLGAVIDPASGKPWEIRMQIDDEFGDQGKRAVKVPSNGAFQDSSNTTLGIVATDAILTKAQANKIAQMTHDGMARAIRPSHTMFDGDTIFCLATGKRPLPESEGFFAAPYAQAINDLGSVAADCMTRAIIHATLSAETLGLFKAFRDLENR